MNQKAACARKLLLYVALKRIFFYNSIVNGTLPLFLPISPYLHGNKRQGVKEVMWGWQGYLCKTRDKSSQCLMHNCSPLQCLMHTGATLHWKHNCWQTGSTARSPCMPWSAELQAKSSEKHRDWKTTEAFSIPASHRPIAVGPVWSWM